MKYFNHWPGYSLFGLKTYQCHENIILHLFYIIHLLNMERMLKVCLFYISSYKSGLCNNSFRHVVVECNFFAISEDINYCRN